MKDNPDLTNLSDPYRPTKLVESFGQVYDDDWTRAFEDLEQTQFLEREIICCLANLLRVCTCYITLISFESCHKVNVYNAYVESEGPDQPAHSRSLIRAFAVR